MKISYLTLIAILLCLSAKSQGIYGKLSGKGKKSNITFYADESGQTEIDKLGPGQTVFYAKIPLNKKDFKTPFGKLAAYSAYNFLKQSAEVQGLKNGISTRDERIYNNLEEMDKTFSELASQGELMVEFKLDEDVNFENSLGDVVENGNDVYPLTVWIGDEKQPVGYGIIDWDLTDGGAAYKAAALASRSNYTFNATDAVNDPEFKATVKRDIERRYKIEIYQMAQGDRVPYTRDLRYYRRNQIGMTYKDLEDGKCYTGGISAFEDGSGPNGPYTYDMQGQISQGDQIPCERVDK